MSRLAPFPAAVRVVVLVALAAGCVGRVLPVPIGVEHPANPSAATGSFAPARPEFSVEAPTWDGAARHPQDPGSHGPTGHGEHGTTRTPLTESAPGAGEHRRAGQPTGHAGHGATPPPAASSAAADQSRIDDAVRAYLALSSALAADDFTGAAEHAKHFRGASKQLAAAQDAALRQVGARLTTSGDGLPNDIAGVREAFKSWSPAVIELVSRTPPSSKATPALREMYCPMAGASWLQVSESVANPYFGAKMPRCGSVTRVIEPREEPAK